MTLGACISPNDAWLVLRSLRTLPIRLEKISATAEKVIQFLKTNDSYLTNILWECIHRCPNLPGHGDGILSIGQAVLIHKYKEGNMLCSRSYLVTHALTLLHKAVVNNPRLYDIYQVYDGQAGLVSLVLEVLDRVRLPGAGDLQARKVIIQVEDRDD